MFRMKASSIYEQLLTPLDHGLPLWFPDQPNDQCGGDVLLGDVGRVENGAFFRFFNALRDADDPVNLRLGVPEQFAPLELPQYLFTTTSDYVHAGPVCSQTVAVGSTNRTPYGTQLDGGATGLSFTCTDGQGAFLVLKENARLIKIESSDIIMRYIHENFARWYWFVKNRLRMQARHEDIVFVSGFVKASEWVVATIVDSKDKAVDFHCGPGPWAASARFTMLEGANLQHRVGPSAHARVRSRPPSGESSDDEPHASSASMDQTVFLQFYKVKYDVFFWPKVIKAAAGPHELPPGNEGEDEGSAAVTSGPMSELQIETVPPVSRIYGPIDLTLDYILKNSDAKFAIVSHEHISKIRRNMDRSHDFAESLQSQRPPIRLIDDVVGMIDRNGHTERSGIPDHSGWGSTWSPEWFDAAWEHRQKQKQLDVPHAVPLMVLDPIRGKRRPLLGTSYSDLDRTRSRILLPLLNPVPDISPTHYPYRTGKSTQNMSPVQTGRSSGFGASGLTMTGYQYWGEEAEDYSKSADSAMSASSSLAKERPVTERAMSASTHAATSTEAPYNPPESEPLSNPRTVRRQPFVAELTEEMRRSLLCEWQVNMLNQTGSAPQPGGTATDYESGEGGSKDGGMLSRGTGEGTAQDDRQDDERRNALERIYD